MLCKALHAQLVTDQMMNHVLKIWLYSWLSQQCVDVILSKTLMIAFGSNPALDFQAYFVRGSVSVLHSPDNRI